MNEPHGGNVYKAAARFGLDREALLDFSANINPLGTPEILQGLLREKVAELNQYPDPDSMNLRTSIARYLSVPAEKIIIGNGASEIISLLFGTLKPRKVLLVTPTFSEYEQAAIRAGAMIEYFFLQSAADFQADLDLLAKKVRTVDCLMICNPNNPTSTLLTVEQLRFLAEAATQSGISMIVDEAFIELTPGGNNNSLVAYLAEYPTLFLIRAFTKIFAVPGLRVGYGLGDPALTRRMKGNQPPWSVNLLADCIADFLPQAGAYLEQTQDWLNVELKWIAESFRQIPFLKVFEPRANFILAEIVSDLKASDLQERLVKQGILIRNAGNFQGLNEKYFRVAVRDRESNLVLINRLRKILSNHGLND
ncbi:MAG TPA: threonine-phosphate decarboxylase [Firmicutes bacterium]|jgi:threonine-phosphate decarboxylase|nr:threonine-phosphate decarboxylase [Bacillota bacterium]